MIIFSIYANNAFGKVLITYLFLEHKAFSGEIFGKTNDELKPPGNLNDGNIWKLLTISEQSVCFISLT